MVCWQYNIPKALVYLSSEKITKGFLHQGTSEVKLSFHGSLDSASQGASQVPPLQTQVTKVDIDQNQQYVSRLPKDTKWDWAVLT